MFKEQQFAVLSTIYEGGIHSCLVAFVARNDLKSMYLCTPRSTRKYSNLREDPRISLLIDDCDNAATDITTAMAVTVTANAREVRGDGVADALALYLDKHPYLTDFVRSPNTAVIEIAVKRYDVVTRFQEVTVLDLEASG